MSRTPQIGLTYISLDVDTFDDPKVLRIEDEFQIKGGYITIRLLLWIYREGYFTKYDDDFPFIFAKRVGNGLTGTLVKEVVAGLIRCGFFDENLFNSFGILTSKGIQKRWQKVKKDCNSVAKIDERYNLLTSEEKSIISEEKPISSEEKAITSEDMQQRKENRNKNSGNITTLPNKDIIPKKKKEKTTNVVVPKNPDFIDELLNIFSEEYKKSRGIDFELTSKGRERKGIGRLLLNHKKKKPDATTEQTQADFRDYIRKCLIVKEDFHYRKMSPSHIADNINEINQLIKGKKPSALTNQKSFTDKQMDYDETWKN